MINDIHLSEEFIKEYQRAPEYVQKAVDKYIRMISIHHIIPNGMRAHLAETNDKSNIYIGYATRSHKHWRILYYYVTDDTICFERLVPHEIQNRYLKEVI